MQRKMNKITSNGLMEREFDILQSVQGLQPPPDLYDKIISKTSELSFRISKKWFAGVAAMIALLICFEVFLVRQSTDNTNSNNELEILIQKENYHLYE